MKILFVASEVSPLVKIGGLGDVINSLPHALTRLGHDVRVVIPQYGCVDISKYPLPEVKGSFEVIISGSRESAGFNMITLNTGIPVYLIKNSRYFGGDQVYGGDDLKRFLFFSKAVFQLLPLLSWQPDVVHCHDWHSALVVKWLKRNAYRGALVFTVHNLAYQGLFDEAFLAESGLGEDWKDCSPDVPPMSYNFMSQGILWADLITTVSETYAREILTPEHGVGLDALLRYRQKDLLGIVNGIDYEEFNPATDPYIPANFDSSEPEKRLVNKLALQKKANLAENPEIPLIGMVQRLDEQKGFDILGTGLPTIMDGAEVQLVILGQGRGYYENMLRHMALKYPGRITFFSGFDNSLAHLIYAASDMFLMPSRFEPCGLGQLIAMRYGALPVVHHTGGLVDTVSELTPDLTQGSGFVFQDYAPEALVLAVKRGIDTFKKNRMSWYQAVQRVMKLDFSWRGSAPKYEAAYRRALETREYPSGN